MVNGVNVSGKGFDPEVLEQIKLCIPEVLVDPPFDMFKGNHLLFSHFIRDIKDGTFNTDECQPFMSHVAFELGAVSQNSSLDLEIQFSEWKRR